MGEFYILQLLRIAPPSTVKPPTATVHRHRHLQGSSYMIMPSLTLYFTKFHELKKMRKYSVQTLLLAFASFLLLFFLSPSIPQPQRYHHFADNRNFFGIPNALNVISNFPFMVIGLIGLVLCHRRSYFNISLEGELWGWKCFYAGVTSVAFGSSYYHLHPDNASLLWDRIPMTIAFASLMATLIIERIDPKKGTHAIVPLIMIGIISNVYWRFFGDIRLYILAQSAACIAIPLMATLLPPMYTHSPYWLWASGFYLLAMLQETTDRVIYALTFHTVSGHTLKHLSAAMVPVILTLMLAKRSVYSGKLLHAKSA
ncbi:uncharacterized protein LOC114179366 [Vigna unguiculata]|uniref:Ceramidase n=1 Tax=Vigna unguiculata TaxID=3917 RepID=A0A4D6L823_VIGUN|nr:uncharacterized protein LOC114179366 [Vigna unguiculata]QCD84653.1 Ceramidase [Vigna unguiculata]